MTPTGRIRRKWAAEEDILLKTAVSKAQDDGRPLIWHEIAANIPGRTNKDCRKRWYGKTAATVNKGAWTPSEDERLCDAVKGHGTKWSVVASDVGTRTGDQCSKRWNHTINPDIDHSVWTSKEDELLLDGVTRYGRNWQQITSINFPRRTSLGAKNRYHLLCRKSSGARTYSKTKPTEVAGTVSTNIDKPDDSLGSDKSDASDSGSEMDEGTSEGDGLAFCFTRAGTEITKASDIDSPSDITIQPGSGTSETDFLDALYGANPLISFGNETDPTETGHDVSVLQYPPFSDPDDSKYMSENLNTDITQRPFSLASATFSPPTPSLGNNASNGTTQSIDDFIMDFSPGPKSALSFDDQSMLDTSALSAHESEEMLSAGLLHTDYALTGTSASFLSNTLSPNLSAGTRFISSTAHERRPGSTRRITIQAVCPADELGELVQAVTERALSAIVKTDDQMSFDTG